MKVLILNSSVPEHYPPTLNAINCIAADSAVQEILLVTRALQCEPWTYPTKVRRVMPNKAPVSVDQSMARSTVGKFLDFAGFAHVVWTLLRTEKPQVVNCIDYLALLAFRWARRWIGYTPTLWYHNHDVIEQAGRFTLTRMGLDAQAALFARLDFFTLPTDDRKACFPMAQLHGRYDELPNVPAISFYRQFYQPKPAPTAQLRFIFQGAIAAGHGLEAILQLAASGTISMPVFLILKGRVQADYKASLQKIAVSLGLADRLQFAGFTDYAEVPKLAAACDIGIGIHTGTDVMNATLGRASNKIYEYAAVGLPVLLFDSPQFRGHLGQYPWAKFTDLSASSLRSCVREILHDYAALSAAAHADFIHELNFEHCFAPFWQKLRTHALVNHSRNHAAAAGAK
jgi:glycosyltransferase involved in cell wall biosynthesis